MRKKLLVALAMAGAFLLGNAQEARAENVLKFGSLAPGQSPWAQVLTVWQRAVKEKSGGELDLRWYWNGTQGDEAAMVGKIKSGQLDGAALTAVGLGKIHKPILVVQMPGIFPSWNKLDSARSALLTQFQEGTKAKGFSIIGWGDVGVMHWFSKGFAITDPDSLKGQKPYVWRDDDIHRMLFQSMPGVTPVPLGVPEVLPALNSGSVNSAHTPALTCEQLQWASRFTHMVNDGHAYMIGALVISDAKLAELPADQRTVLMDTGKVAGQALTDRIRGEDRAALARLKGKLTAHDLTDSEKAAWSKLYAQVRQRLGQQGVFAPDLIQRVEGLGR